jgi:hypothetical protein
MKNLFSLLFVALAAPMFAQGIFSVAPLNPSAVYPLSADDPKAENRVTNNASTTKNIRWERTIIDLCSDGCDTYVCDPVYCYGPNASAKTFPLESGAQGLVSVHLLRNDPALNGWAVVRLKFFDVDNPADSLLSVYTVNAQTVSTAEQTAAAQVKLYPNPTVDFFTLENAEVVAAIRVFSLDGRQTAYWTADTNQQYSLAGHNAGNYIVVLESKAGQALRAIEIVKQ